MKSINNRLISSIDFSPSRLYHLYVQLTIPNIAIVVICTSRDGRNSQHFIPSTIISEIICLNCFLFSLICRSEEHTSELQSRGHLVCRLLLEKKNYCNTLNCMS